MGFICNGEVIYLTSLCEVTLEDVLTHWGRVTHICIGNLTIIGSDNGLSPERRQAIIWTNAGILLIGPLGTNFSGISIGIQTFSFKKMHFKMSSAKWRPFCLGLNVLSGRKPIYSRTQHSANLRWTDTAKRSTLQLRRICCKIMYTRCERFKFKIELLHCESPPPSCPALCHPWMLLRILYSLQRHHNERDGISNHRWIPRTTGQ